jgi:hypothetical protein
MASFVTYNFPNHTSGDTFSGVSFQVKINSIAKSLVGAVIKMYISDKIFSTITGEIEISDPLNGRFQLKEQSIILPAYTHIYKIDIIFADGKKKTYIKGTWVIE